jgi:pilus assembly protein Flp/PilA
MRKGIGNQEVRELEELGRLCNWIRRPARRQEGQGMVEYALILVLVSIVAIVTLILMGGTIKNVFSNVVSALSTT